MMDQNQTPPQFEPRRSKAISNKMIIFGICMVVLCALAGFGGALIATNLHSGSGITVNKQSGNAGSGNQIEDVSDIAAKCGPSVVEITTEAVTSGNSIFGQYVQQGAGSGVIFSEDGYIITNNHVIEGATSIAVRTQDGTEYKAQLVGTDAQTDLAVIKIDASGLTPATIGESSSLQVGDAAIAIGNPLGELGGTVTTGIISALDREITVEDETMTLLQTDAAINPGNSGGGLFDANGNLIGIVNAKESSTGVEGLGFAIPIDGAMDIINELIENGSVTSRPALNVSLYDYSSSNSLRRSDMEDGVYIVQVVQGGAADKAGLQQGDRIISFDGKEVNTSAEVKAILRDHKIGDTVSMTVSRDGKTIDVQITLQQQSS